MEEATVKSGRFRALAEVVETERVENGVVVPIPNLIAPAGTIESPAVVVAHLELGVPPLTPLVDRQVPPIA